VIGINPALVLFHVLLQRPQPIAGGMIQQFGFTFMGFGGGNFHNSMFRRKHVNFN
jgi:hypothetical protein